MNIFLVISLILASVSCVFSLLKQLQMLQQNSYFPSRYFKWLKDSYTVELAVLSVLFCASSTLYLNERYLLQTVLFAVLLVVKIFTALNTHKKSIKKLVFTARIKRLFATAVIVFLALIGLFFASGDLYSEISAIVLFMLSIVSPLCVFLIWLITYPIEKAVSAWYVNDAKKILASHKNLTVIGVTGSYGKTTTKFILNRILSEKFNVVCTPQSFNTPMGVVRTVRGDLKPQTQIFICEMGAKNVGDIKEICDIANPAFGIITSVGPQHLETFKSVDNVYKTKFELADAVEKNGGKVFINGDNREIMNRTQKGKYISFGLNDTNSFYAENISYNRSGSSFTLVLDGERVEVNSKLLGMHSVADITAAAAVAYTLGVSADDIKFAISQLKPTEHRLELKPFKNSSLLIDDAYNANPEGSLEAVRILSHFDGMRKTVITPGLIELGSKEYECNFNLGVEAAKYADRIILVGENRSKPIRDGVESTDFNLLNLFVVKSFNEAMSLYLSDITPDSVVLLENDLPDNYLK